MTPEPPETPEPTGGDAGAAAGEAAPVTPGDGGDQPEVCPPPRSWLWRKRDAARQRYENTVRRLLAGLGADPDKYASDGSRWPSSRHQFLWDLSPSKVAPNRDGIAEPPTGDSLDWTHTLEESLTSDDLETLYQSARTFRKDADDTTRNLELKASRLATVLVALLTANVALVVFEITRLGPDPSSGRAWLVGFAVVFGCLAAVYLIVGLTRAVDADQRMGITGRAELKDVALDKFQAAIDEADGYRISDWTRLQKADRLLDARAAVSRSMVFSVISAVFALALAFVSTLHPDESSGKNPTPARSTSQDSGDRSRGDRIDRSRGHPHEHGSGRSNHHHPEPSRSATPSSTPSSTPSENPRRHIATSGPSASSSP